MSPLRRTLRYLVLFAAGVAVAWFVLPSFITPEEADAVREPPATEPLTVPVEVGRLREVLVLEGEVRPRIEITVDPWAPVLASRAVVTFVPDSGSEIRSGEPAVGLSGRPLIFMSGMLNLYRDLYRGLTGSDVKDLQSALLDLGYLDAAEDVNGVFGPRTEEAVATLYRDIGFAPAPPPQGVPTAEVLLMAKDAVEQARQELGDAKTRGNSTSVEAAERNLAFAEAQLDALQGVPGLSIPADEVLGLPYEALITQGSMYKPGDLVHGETPLVQLRTPETLIVASATLAQRARLAPGLPVTLLAGNHVTVATLTEVVTTEPGSATDVLVRIDADAAGASVGTQVTVEVELESTANEVVSVPISAIRTNADGRSFVTVVHGGRQTEHQVQLGATIGGRTEILSGLIGGELVVVG